MKNSVYIVNWPDNTISIITASNEAELFWNMNVEGDPSDPKVKIKKVIPDENGNFHITSEFIRGTLKVDTHFENDCKLKRFRFGPDFTDDAYYALRDANAAGTKD